MVGQTWYRLQVSKPHLSKGLSIAKELVELHDGRIWAESSDQNGSEFIIALRLDIPATGLL